MGVGKRQTVAVIFILLFWVAEGALARTEANRVTTADHSRFDALQKPFASGPDVTRACLGCHNEAGNQFMETIHWTWVCPKSEDGSLGKAGKSLNNFCISIPGNEPRCTSCHAGFGYKDDTFDFSDPEQIDCLVCHEQTGTYQKFPSGAGHPVKKEKIFKGNGKPYFPPDWQAVAASVARPTRNNCGTCHFFGGGGDGVKHGDLDSSLFHPDKKLDVHMAANGEDFTCTRCHTTVGHKVAGRCYQTPAAAERKSLLEDDMASRITCVSCHGNAPHTTTAKLNDHTDTVACQTCHIPTFAREKPTKMFWDWSVAGRKEKGKPVKIMGEFGKPVYMTKKGKFVWDQDVVPEYAWFDGVIRNTLVTDTIDPASVVAVNFTDAGPDTPGARIYPFKVHRAVQPYDRERNTLVFPKLFGKKGSGAYWAEFNWERAVAEGMKAAGLPFSGKVGFVESAYRYPITHMVAPAGDALTCEACHTRTESRLAGITGVYMPGRDGGGRISEWGWMATIAACAGVVLHGLGRVMGRNRKKREKETA